MHAADPSSAAARDVGGARFAGPHPAGRRGLASGTGRAVGAGAVAVVVGLLVGRFLFLGPSRPAASSDQSSTSTAAASVAAATAAVAADPTDPQALERLGLAYLSDARKTADPTSYRRAADALDRSLAIDPGDYRTLTAAGLVALARHDFTGALDLGQRANAAAPTAVDPLGVIVDAQVELGRYDDAAASVAGMVARRPNLASLARASYVAELRGDRDAALAAMQQAIAAAPADGPDVAYVLALLGDLQLAGGKLDAAEASYARAQAAFPGQPQATLGHARVLADRGDLAGAAGVLADLTNRLPLPDAVSLYGDVLAARGDVTGANAQYQLVRAIETLNKNQGGIAVDLELARFEAVPSHGGNADDAVTLARAAYSARPTVYGADVLAWALRNDGRAAEALPLAQQATRLGTKDATLWWHLAAIEADLGHESDARTHLRTSHTFSPFVALAEQAEARQVGARLGVQI